MWISACCIRQLPWKFVGSAIEYAHPDLAGCVGGGAGSFAFVTTSRNAGRPVPDRNAGLSRWDRKCWALMNELWESYRVSAGLKGVDLDRKHRIRIAFVDLR
jgi:hypothetical protein